MKNRTIRERYAALLVLSQRVLPSPAAINKVSILLKTRFHQPYEATEVSRKQIIEQHPVPEGWERDNLPASIAEARQRELDAYLNKEQLIRKVPDSLKLTLADMPRVLKREGGESNAEGVAQIIVMLGTLYKPTGEELTLNSATEGVEPDEDAIVEMDPVVAGLTPNMEE